MAGARRFLARLDFFLLQPERIPARPPRALLEAMAVGRVALLAPGFRALLGEGLAYRTPEQMAPTVRYLHAEPAFYDRYLAAQDKAPERYTLDAPEPPCPSSSLRRHHDRPRSERTAAGSPSTPPTASASATWPGCWRWRSAWVPRTSPSSSRPATRWP